MEAWKENFEFCLQHDAFAFKHTQFCDAESSSNVIVLLSFFNKINVKKDSTQIYKMFNPWYSVMHEQLSAVDKPVLRMFFEYDAFETMPANKIFSGLIPNNLLFKVSDGE